MTESEFNLSVLENVTSFVSPLKYSANYDTILNLIKEEIDINSEDETEWRKTGKHLGTKQNHAKSGDYETIFKSPFSRNASLKPKSYGGSGERRRFDRLRNERFADGNNSRRARSLGAVKPGRSVRLYSRTNRSSVSRSSETSLSDYDNFTGLETPTDRTENGNVANEEREVSPVAAVVDAKIVEPRRRNGVTPADGETTESAPEDENSGEASAVKTFLASADSLARAATENDFAQSSRSATASDLRKRPVDRRSTRERSSTLAENRTGGDGIICSEESEAESQSFSLAFSPGSKSQGSNDKRESSVTPPRPPSKRKANTSGAVEGSTPKKQKRRDATSSKSQGSDDSENIEQSPLKGLSRELENCIAGSDCEQLAETLQVEMAESASFTFETIELLNDYGDSNESANNSIWLKILASPTIKIKEEAPDCSAAVDAAVESIRDPLRIERNEKKIIATTRASKKSPGLHGRATITAREAAQLCRGSARKSLKEIADIAPTGAKSKKSLGEAADGETMDTDELEKADGICLKSDLKKTNGNATRRSARKSTRSNGGSIKNLSELMDDEDLAVEAADVSKKIEAAQRKSALADETVDKLQNLVIRLRHKVLPQHEIENRAGSKALTYEQQIEFIRLAPLNKDTYSTAEDGIIKSNWQAFCEDHNWDPRKFRPFLNLRHGSKLIMSSLEERRKFVQFLADGLPNRPLCSVYTRFKVLYGRHPIAGSRYSPEEDVKILAYMLHKPVENSNTKCSELAKVLNRSRESIWKRFEKLKRAYCHEDEKKGIKKVEWNLPFVEKFIRTLIDVTLSEDLMELKNAFIPKVVWLKMEEKMKIDHQLMKRFWEQQLHLQLFAARPLHLNRIKVSLIEHMYTRKMWHPAEIKWRHIVKDFDGFTISFLRKIFNHLTMEASVKLRSRNLERILKWLYTEKIEQLTTEPREKCLPRVLYEVKRAKLFDENMERIRLHSENISTN